MLSMSTHCRDWKDKQIFNLYKLLSYQNEHCFNSVIMNVWIFFVENGCSEFFKSHLLNHV